MAARKSTKTLRFEDGLTRLEVIAEQMEKSELPLDELLKLYEEGIKLSEELKQKLEQTHGRMMEIRLNKDGTPSMVATDLVKQESLLQEGGEEE